MGDKGAALINATIRDWLDRHGDERFFMFINYDEAHASYAPPSPYRETYLADRADTPWGRERAIAPMMYNAGFVDYTAEVGPDVNSVTLRNSPVATLPN